MDADYEMYVKINWFKMYQEKGLFKFQIKVQRNSPSLNGRLNS